MKSVFRTLSNTSDVAFYENSWRPLAISYHYKTHYLWCLTGFWIRLRKSFFDKRNFYTKRKNWFYQKKKYSETFSTITEKDQKLRSIWATKCKLTCKHLFWVASWKSSKDKDKGSSLFAYACFLYYNRIFGEYFIELFGSTSKRFEAFSGTQSTGSRKQTH